MRELTSEAWKSVRESLSQNGFALLPKILDEAGCRRLIDNYDSPDAYRNTISMQRYRFGAGEYKYFDYPLPKIIRTLRESLYPPLVSTANLWSEILKLAQKYPDSHDIFIGQCHRFGQALPTPLILRYGKSGYNTLHQDLYGEVFFPFQVVIVLSQKDRDFTGGELVFMEQIPRAQSKATVVNPQQGDAVVFTTRFRPVKGTKGYYRSVMKHGISEVKSGERYALGIIFHDAK
jgi:hypothetical protein